MVELSFGGAEQRAFPAPSRRFGTRQQVSLGWAFVERQTNLWKRHWAWEIVWLVYGVVNTLAITFIAKQLAAEGVVSGRRANDLIVFLLIGTLVWAYLSAVLDDISLVVTWERWEGTIEHTLMAPVPRVLHLLFGDHPTGAERIAMAMTWERLHAG